MIPEKPPPLDLTTSAFWDLKRLVSLSSSPPPPYIFTITDD
jgi:hypothetical protein